MCPLSQYLLSPQEPQRHQQRACHCPLHPPPRPHFWTLHPSGLQISASPSELQFSKDQYRARVQVAGKGLTSMFYSGVVWASPSLLSPGFFPMSLSMKGLLPSLGHHAIHYAHPTRNLVPGSAGCGATLTHQIPAPGRQIQREPGIGMLPVEGGGGAFATICNLFSKVYFVTIYLSLKKGKLHHHSPSPPPKKKIFQECGWCGYM